MAQAYRQPHDTATRPAHDIRVRQFHQILLWPLQLMPLKEGAQIHNHWELLEQLQNAGDPIWRELTDEFPEDPAAFQERHYREFATFLPRAQRFLYGEHASRFGRTTYGESPIRIYRRNDIRRLRTVLRAGDAPVEFDVAHVDLYFFFDVDIVILAFELFGADIALSTAQDFLHRFGRAYPAGWSASGEADNCPERVEWLDADGRVIAVSDYTNRAKFVASVCHHIAPALADHWSYLLRPMDLNHGEQRGPLRYRQLEYYRMPTMAYLAVDDPCAIAEADQIRLALGVAPDRRAGLPYSSRFLADFDKRYCYDRYYDPGRGGDWADTRIMCTGHGFVAIGDANKSVFTDPERGFLAQFRHQIFLLGLVAHFHRAALLMLSDRLMSMITRLDIDKTETVRAFRHDIRDTQEIFLRFTHRYWFSEVSDQGMTRDLFRLWSEHLSLQRLHDEMRQELHDMSTYLDSDMLRRQSTTIVRLTVVTMMSIIGTVTTGFLGMNLLAWADESFPTRIGAFMVVLLATTWLTYLVLRRSQPIARFLESVADTRKSWRDQLKNFLAIFIGS